MKYFDCYKLSLHNIKNNKSRSILTTIIVYVISLLIMSLLCIGLSFSGNLSSITKEYYRSAVDEIVTDYYNYEGDYEGKKLDNDTYLLLKDVLKKHENVISYVKYEQSNISNVLFEEYKFPISNDIEIIEGNNVDSSLAMTNKILASTDFVSLYYTNTGTVLKPGDTFDYTVNYSYNEGNVYVSADLNLSFEVQGIFKAIEKERSSTMYYQENLVSANDYLIVDAGYALSKVMGLSFSSASFYYVPSKVNFNEKELLNLLDGFVTDISNVLPYRYDARTDTTYESVYCSALDSLQFANLSRIIIVGVLAVICLILILLSIGSLANTIMISVDKNKKFIGLLKALGLNEKDLKRTIKMESISTITFGIILSFLTITIFENQFSMLNSLLVNSTYSTYLSYIDYKIFFDIPIYIPLIVAVFFIFFTLLFSRSSMSKIAKTDPMSVISEVA